MSAALVLLYAGYALLWWGAGVLQHRRMSLLYALTGLGDG